MFLELIATIAAVTSTFDGMPYYMSDELEYKICGQGTNGCNITQTNDVIIREHILKSDKKTVLCHEQGHYYYQWVFYDTFNSQNAMLFWTKRPWQDTNSLDYWLSEKDKPWESMAYWYQEFCLGKKIDKDLIRWFMYSGKDYSKSYEKYNKFLK